MTEGNSPVIRPGEGPVRGGHAAVDQAGLGREERAGTDADDAAGVLGRGLYPRDELRIEPGIVDPETAGQDQRVERIARIGQGPASRARPVCVVAGSPVRVTTPTE